jgi:RNA polymerase sigma-70 factor, ECF subfamily
MIDWPTIVKQHSPIVWQTAWRLLGNHADASDCYQETFTCVLTLSRQQEIKNWPAILKRIATTRAIDRLRQRIRQNNRTNDLDDWDALASQNPGPVRQTENLELGSRLRQALARLPADQAQVFCLKFLEEMTYEEIAGHLGLDTNTVGVLLHRARNKLKTWLTAARDLQEK